MIVDQRLEGWCMPPDSPAYPVPPPYYYNTILQTVYFLADKDNIARLLPKPLEPGDNDTCAAFALKAGWCSHWGPFNEVGVVVPCVFKGEPGFFLPCLFLSSSDAIAPGREVWGCPKKLAHISLEQYGAEITTTAVRAGVPFMRLNTRCIGPAKPDEVPSLWPMYLLKIIPKCDKPEPAVKQLCLNGELGNVVTHKLFKGPGVVSFEPTVAGDFWRLQPKEFLGAFYHELDFTQGWGKVVHNYLG
jgi:acetoacetate decarboxylase